MSDPSLQLLKNGFTANRPSFFRLCGVVVQVLRFHFSQSAYILEPAVKDQVYSADPGVSGLRIDHYCMLNLKQAEVYPAISVSRTDIREQSYVLGDKEQMPGALPSLSRPQSVGELGDNIFKYAVSGGIRVVVMDLTPASAELRAEEAVCCLRAMAPLIRDFTACDVFRVAEIGALGMMEETNGTHAVPIGIEVKYPVDVKNIWPRPLIQKLGLVYQNPDGSQIPA